jgi:TonB dependent receptor
VGTAGDSLASILLGLPPQNNTTTVAHSNRVSTYAFYAQEVWTLNQKLTLTDGLRFDHRCPLSLHVEVQGIIKKALSTAGVCPADLTRTIRVD